MILLNIGGKDVLFFYVVDSCINGVKLILSKVVGVLVGIKLWY